MNLKAFCIYRALGRLMAVLLIVLFPPAYGQTPEEPEVVKVDLGGGFSASDMDGDTLIVGAHTAGSFPRGFVYIFDRNQDGPGQWGQVARLTAPSGADLFGCSVSIRGETAVVGAYGENSKGSFTGAAYVYQKNRGGANAWGLVAKLSATDSATGDWFGLSVAISGDTVVVGADRKAGGGAAYVFHRNQNGPDAWGQVAKLLNPDTGNVRFGFGVAIDGNTTVIGAMYTNPGGVFRGGALYVYEASGSSWQFSRRITPPHLREWEGFGQSPAIRGDLIASTSGDRTCLFERHSGGVNTWGLVATFGFFSLPAIGEDKMVLGDRPNEAAYLYQLDHMDSDPWNPVMVLRSTDPGPDDLFGGETAISGNTIAISAPRQGAVYIFTLKTAPPQEPLNIVCPEDTILHTESSSQCSVVVTFAPGVTGGVAPVQVWCWPPSGSVFSEGLTVVACTATDSAGEEASCFFTVQVVVPDRPPPELHLLGDNPIILECGNVYREPGAEASDICDGPLTVNTSGVVNPNAPGLYVLAYTATNTLNMSRNVQREIVVADTRPPVITLLGPEQIIVECNTVFSDPGAIAWDICAGDLSADIFTTGYVDTSNPGYYEIMYEVSDPSGNSAIPVIREVVVVSTAARLDNLEPSSITAGSGDFSLLVSGACFPEGARVLWDGSPLETERLSHSQLLASIPASAVQTTPDITLVIVTVQNPDGGISNPGVFTIKAGIVASIESVVASPGETVTVTDKSTEILSRRW